MSQNLNSAGKIAKIFINHPLTGILGIFILILGYFARQFMPKEDEKKSPRTPQLEWPAKPNQKSENR